MVTAVLSHIEQPELREKKILRQQLANQRA